MPRLTRRWLAQLAGLAVAVLPAAAAAAQASLPAAATAKPAPVPTAQGPSKQPDSRPLWDGALLRAETHDTKGSYAAAGRRIAYRAVAGTMIVRPRGAEDAAASKPAPADPAMADPEAAMSYVAYFRTDDKNPHRPVMFLYNGGLTTATVWLHIGAFGPKRLQTAPNSYTPPAPYRMVENPSSLIDVADLVFVDAPGAGFGRIAGRGKEQAFWGNDADAFAFKQFIGHFLTRFDRWNSPKYLFGESFGTMRSAVLINMLQSDNVDFNGVLLMSPVLSLAFSNDFAAHHPGIDQPYVLEVPSYAAAAWYHDRIPGGRPADLKAFLAEAEQFADGDYAQALHQGSELSPERKRQVAEKLASYIGLPADYIVAANLRITIGQFAKTLLVDRQTTIGRLDARFTGPTFDPLVKEAEYDPQMTATWAAYNSAYNDYSRQVLGIPPTSEFKLNSGAGRAWNWVHRPERAVGSPLFGGINVMTDLAAALEYNPYLRVSVLSGLYDLGTPYWQARYEMRHLGVNDAAYKRIEFHCYPTGHMIYVDEDSTARLHRDVSDFIQRTSQPPANRPDAVAPAKQMRRGCDS